MALDGLFMHRLLEELSEDLVGAKINRVHQPDKHTVIFKLNQARRGNFNMLLTVHPQDGRFHITEKQRENPASPPLFAMVLRKHLEGGRILSLSQHGFDRIVDIEIEGWSDTGEWVKNRLIVEIMGKHSNLILCDEQNTILAAIKPYGAAVSRHRQVLPNLPYVLPPHQEKLNPLLMTESEWSESLLAQDLSLPLAKALFATVEGLSPQTAAEIVYRCALDRDYPLEEVGVYELERLFGIIQNLLSSPVRPGTTGKEFYFQPLEHLGEPDHIYTSLSSLLDDFFDRKERQNAFQSRKTSLTKVIKQYRDKLDKKISKQQKELAAATDGETYRRWGELLSANLYRIPDNVAEITLEDFYNNNAPVTIPLRPDLPPSANAGRYFKRFTKAKSAKQSIEKQLETNAEELQYLEALCDTAERCEDERTLKEIRKEAVSSGYLKEKRDKKQKERDTAPLPPIECEMDGFTILIGRNNKQNDNLTLRKADKEDLWLHTKDIPGSHVIIRREGREIPDHVIAKAAQYAAYHSRAAGADKVPVDYTEVRHVKKPNGARPGMVIYFEQATLYVKPEPPLPIE